MNDEDYLEHSYNEGLAEGEKELKIYKQKVRDFLFWVEQSDITTDNPLSPLNQEEWKEYWAKKKELLGD